MFTIDLKSRDYLKSIAIPHDRAGRVLIEGFLGKLDKISFTEESLLEVSGDNGCLRIDLNKEELEQLQTVLYPSIKKAS